MKMPSDNIPTRALEPAAKTQSQPSREAGSISSRPQVGRWLKHMFLLCITVTLASAPAWAATTYTWVATSGSAAWTTTTSWSPTRTTPATDDILVFSGGGSSTATAVPAQTIGKLQISGNTTIILQAGAANTLTIGGGATALSVASGSALNISGANALTISLPTGTSGSISGTMNIAGGAHRLNGVDAATYTFQNGATVTADTGFSGSLFSSAGAGYAVFAGGSTYVNKAGGHPSNSNGTSSQVIFQTGSKYSHQQASAPAFSSRTYADFEWNVASTQSATGSGACVVSNLTVLLGTLNIGMTGPFNIIGNVTVTGNLTLNAASAATINFSGTSVQTISGAGTLTINSTEQLNVNPGATVSLQRSIATVAGTTVTVGSGGALYCGTSAITGAGAFTLAAGGTLGIGSTSGLNSTPGAGTIQVTGTRTFSSAATYIYNNAANSQSTGDQLPATVYGLTITNAGPGGNNTVTLNTGSPITITGPLQVNSGLFSPIGASSAGTLSFDIGATAQATGTWGSTTSGALNQNNGKFAGSGTVNVAGGSITVGSGTQYRSIASGEWSSAATWEASNDGTTWTTMYGGVYPGQSFAGNSIRLRSPNVVNYSLVPAAANTLSNLTVDSGATLGLSGGSSTTDRVLPIGGNLTNSGTITIALGGSTSPKTTLTFSGASSVWAGSGDISGVKANFAVNANSTLDISPLTTPITARSSGTAPGSISGTLITGTQVIGANGNASWTLSLASGGTIITANLNGLVNGTVGTFNMSTPPTLSTGANYTFTGAGAQVTLGMPGTVNNLTITNASGVTLSAAATVNGTLALTKGQLNNSSQTLTLANGITTAVDTGSLSAAPTFGTTVNVNYTGTTAVNTGNEIPSSSSVLNNLTINKSGGVTLGANATVNGTLTFTSGKITTGANTLSLGSSATISGAGSTAYVIGNLNKPFSTGSGQSYTFPVGSSSAYAPVSLANLNVGTAGNLTASSTGSEQPNIATSSIDFSKDVNRYWTLTAGGGLVASAYDVTLNYVAGDIDGGATPANFIVQKYSAGWTTPTTSAVSGTSATATGLSAFGDFAVGESAGVAATQVLVETAADGSGSVVSAQNITAGSGITVYAVTRAADNSFVANVASTWSLPTKTGGVVNGDLVPAGDSKSATFTGHLVGTATVRASFGGLTPTDSGLLTVVTGSATQVRVETASDGSGTVVPSQTLTSPNSIAVYAITRDAGGNFLANAAADAWTMANKTGGVVDSDLSPTSGTSSTFTANLSGAGNVRASISGLTSVDSGLFSVNAPALTWSATPADFNWNNTSADWTGGAGIFNDNNAVTFNDAGSDTSPISLVGALAPSSVSVNTSTKAYTLAGSGAINGSGTTLTKSGASALTIQTANGYTGGTTISSGAVNVQNNTALGTGSAAVMAGAGLQIAGGRTIANAVTLNGTGTNSDGALRSISGANSLSTGVALGSSGVRINADAGSLTLDVAAGNAITGTAANLTFGGSGDVTVADPIATTSGTLTKDGSGKLTLSGANTFTGATTVSGGVLAIQNNTALGTAAGSTTVSGSGAAVEVSGGLTAMAEPITINGSGVSGAGAIRNTSGNNIWSGAITLGSAARINSDSGTLTTSGAIAGSGNALTIGGAGSMTVNTGITGTGTSLTKEGAGTLTLRASNPFTGVFNLNGGIVDFDSGNSRLGAAGTAVTFDGGTLRWNGISTDITTATGAHTVSLNAGGGTFDTSLASATVSVATGPSIQGSGPLTKVGSGELRFTAVDTARTGDTIVQEGTLGVDQDGQFSSQAASPLGTLYLDGGTFNQSASGRSFANAHGNPVIVRSNSVITTISTSTGTIDIYFTNDVFTSQSGGGITVSNGAGTGTLALRLYGQGFDFAGGITLRDDSGSAKGIGSLRSYNASGTQTFSGLISGGGTYRRNSSAAGAGLAGNTVFSGDNIYSGGVTLVDGGIGLGLSSTGSPTVTSGPLGTGSLAVSPGAGTLPAIFASGGARTIGNYINITGNFGPLIISGANNLTLTGPVNLGGNTDTIQVDNSAATEFSGIITNGGLTKTGSGTLKLSGVDTYAGNTTISNGTLTLGVGGALPNTPTITLAGGTTFDVSASGFALGGSQTIYNNGTTAATITGSLDLSASGAKAKFEITGGGSPTAGKLIVSGALTLNGNTLNVNVSGPPLALGTSVRLMDAATVTGAAGAIPSLTGTALPAGLTASVVTTPGVNGHVDLIVSCDGSLSASAAADAAICVGGSYSLNGTATGGGGSYAYSWTSSPAGFTSSSANPSVSPTASTIYALTVTDANGCTAPALVTVTVNPLPTTAAITGTNSVQQLATAAYSVANTAGSTYGWTVPAGASFTGGTGNSINVTFGSTSGNVSVIETNATGCTGTQQSLFVNVISCTSPVIVGGIDPTNVTATVGDQVILTLTNVAGTSLAFQWQSNNVDIAGATYSSYTNASVTVADAGNYQVVVTNDCGAITSSFAVLTVNKQTPLMASAPAATTNLIYGQTLAGAALSGGSVTNAAGATIAGSFDYSTPSAVPNAGTISESVTFTPNDTNNYNNVSTSVSVTVNQAALGITANDVAKTYDGLGYSGGNGVAYAGFVNGDNAGSLGGGLSYGGTSQTATNAGSYSIVPAGQSSANYAISYTNGTLVINPRAASVTADAKTKTYGDVNPGLTAAVAGTVISDTLSYTLATDATQFSSVGVSNITVTLGSNPNYSVLTTNNTLTIGAKAASVTANNVSKNYGQTVIFAGTEFTSSGLVGGDAVTSVSLASSGAVSTAPVNTYAIVPGSAVGSGLGNYNLGYTNGTLTVNAATPVVINSPVQLPDGNFQLTFTGGDAGVGYQIQASTDLGSPVWSVLAINIAATNGLPSFTDLDATNNPIRFYRTVVP